LFDHRTREVVVPSGQRRPTEHRARPLRRTITSGRRSSQRRRSIHSHSGAMLVPARLAAG
jgi:hypothetical protein